MLRAPENCGCSYQDPGASVANSPVCNGFLVFMAVLETFINARCAISQPCERIVGDQEFADQYDFIVVGGGTAGSIVAGRLAEVESYKVLLIEAGGVEPVPSRVPSFYRSYWSNNETDWMYRTVPADFCLEEGSKGCVWPRGKVLGGSSVLNGMMYHRGHRADYEDWVSAGAEGWSWDENLPFFNMSEDNKQVGSLVRSEYHSTGGPMPVQQFRYQPDMVYDLLKALNESGFDTINDISDPETPIGFAVAQTFNDDGQRFTTARAYLESSKKPDNLNVLLNSHVTKVVMNGTKAVGLEYIQDGERKVVSASKEVILSAGALNSPQILMLSGIGQKEALDNLNIPVVADLPVGQNMRNHLGVTFYFLLEKLENNQTLDWAVATEYLLQRTGPMSADGITQLTGLQYSSIADVDREQPDLQFFFNGFYAECSSGGAIDESVDGCYQSGKNISANVVGLLPRSVGYLTLDPSNPEGYPLFYPEFFTEPEDMTLLKDGVKLLQKVIESSVLTEKYGIKLDPSYSLCDDAGSPWSEAWVECSARQYTDPQNHQLGTASIGSVLDTRLRVTGIEGLRVIDASSMPTQVTGNPQAAIMMVAERGASMIKEDWS